MKTKKTRTAKMYTVNTERKRIFKQRKEHTLQNAKDRKLAKEYFLTASQASCKANRTLKDTQKGRKSNNGSINGDNTNTTTLVDNINNLEIVADNVANATTNVESIDTEFVNTDNINNAEIENDKSEDIVMSDDNDDNPTMTDKDSPHIASGNDNAQKGESDENRTEDVPSPLIMVGKQLTQLKLKPQEGVYLLWLNPWNLQWVIHLQIKRPQVKQKVMHLILLTCEYMNSSFKVHQTLKI